MRPETQMVEAQHVEGFWPTDDAGITADGVLRHRYQHHDDTTGHLVYYQYEAKRHPHVWMLDKFGIQSCVAWPAPGNQTIFGLVLERNAQLRNGSVIVAKACDCYAKSGVLWRTGLQERVVADPRVRATPEGPRLELWTLPAALKDVFEHSHVEYFRGR